MKNLLFVLFTCFQISFAYSQENTWADLELDELVNTSISADMPRWTMPQDNQLIVNDIVGLEFIKVVVFVMKWRDCSRDDQIEEVEIFSYLDSSTKNVEVGLALDRCIVNIFVENKDLNKETFFRR